MKVKNNPRISAGAPRGGIHCPSTVFCALAFILVFFLSVSIPLVFVDGAAAADDEMDFLHWRMVSQDKTRDGGMRVSFTLCLPRGAEDLEVAYRTMPRGGSGGEPETYRKRPDGIDGDAASVTIYSGREENVELMARARRGDAWQYASAVFSCFGESGNADPDAERGGGAEWPVFHVETGPYYFRAQTGMPLKLSLDSGPESILVFERGVPAGAIPRDAPGGYTYVPPNDDELSEAGYTAKKDVVLAAAAHSGLVSFYVPVYRAFYGKTDLRGGIATLSASALAVSALVIRSGRRFPWR